MAKELPYFKFEPSEWDNGNIQMCSRESKGMFIDMCSIYWSRVGELPYALALQKLCNGNKDALKELVEHEIIGVVDGQIVIDFLDEQLSERGQISNKRRESAKKRWSDASALQMESKSNANRKEEKKVEDKRKEELPDFVEFKSWSDSIIDGNDFVFAQKFKNEFPNWGGGAEKFVEVVNDHFDMLNRYPKMNPNTQERFRNSVIKHFREYKGKQNGTGKKGFDADAELKHIISHANK